MDEKQERVTPDEKSGKSSPQGVQPIDAKKVIPIVGVTLCEEAYALLAKLAQLPTKLRERED